MNAITLSVPMLTLAVTVSASLPSVAQSDMPLEVYTYASQVNDVDSVNNHWFETDEGVVLVDAQRLLPEARRALAHLEATTEKPVVAISLTHAHTDHYGGLPVWTQAFPDAQVYTDEVTLNSIRTDARGFIAMRNERHGKRFATQEQLDVAVSEARAVDANTPLEIGDTTLTFEVLGPSEAESTLLIALEDENVAFVGDLINVGVPAVPFEDIDRWLDQLETFTARFDENDRLFNGHGPAPVGIAGITEQRRFLQALRDQVAAALADDELSDDETQQIVFDLEAEWPFYAGVAGNTRREILAFDA
nr:MBL fold metallo-hydrolase [uncultured Halomonas sp.]